MKITTFITGETTTLEIAVHVIEAYYHWCNLLPVLAERQFWNMLVYLFPAQSRSLAKLYGDIILVNYLTKLWREVLNGIAKLAVAWFFGTLVCSSNHCRCSGGITAGSFLSNWNPFPSLLPRSSIEGISQILFRRGTQHFPVFEAQLQVKWACELRNWTSGLQNVEIFLPLRNGIWLIPSILLPLLPRSISAYSALPQK